MSIPTGSRRDAFGVPLLEQRCARHTSRGPAWAPAGGRECGQHDEPLSGLGHVQERVSVTAD
jgi:hypothetical protein